jgi:predicted ester cyclase
MSVEQNKAVVRRLVEEVINKGNIGLFDELVASDLVDHALPPGFPPGAQGTKQFFGLLRAAFPDLRYAIESAVGEGDYVVQRLTAQGTMKGEFMGMKPNGKHAVWSSMDFVRLKDGKVVEYWGIEDQLSMLQQLGFAPTLGQSR